MTVKNALIDKHHYCHKPSYSYNYKQWDRNSEGKLVIYVFMSAVQISLVHCTMTSIQATEIKIPQVSI